MMNKDELLPPKPGEKPLKKGAKSVPYIIYIGGLPVEISKKEALSIMAQIVNITMYLDDHADKEING